MSAHILELLQADLLRFVDNPLQCRPPKNVGLAHEAIPSFINMATAVADADGKIRVIVSAKDPGYANWICTGGLRIGLLTVRWNEKEGEERMEAKLVDFDKISAAMPTTSARVNPEERRQLLLALRSHILRRYGR